MTVAGVLSKQRKSDDGIASSPGHGFHLRCQFCFQIIRFDVHFARGDFFLTCAVIAELADSKAILGANRRPEDAARHRPCRIQVAHACLGVEHWTNLIICKVGESLLPIRRIVKNPCPRIAGEFAFNPRNRLLYTSKHAPGTFWIDFLELSKAGAQALRIELADGKHSYAALRAPRTADKPLAAAPGCIGQRCIYDLHELPIG
jgi:hypothetical protein